MTSLINFSGLESAMREILLQLKSQADEIASLKANSNTYAMKSDVVELERKMDVRFSALEKRVEQLERETAVDSSLTLDEKLLSNSSERIPIARFIRAHDSRLEKTTRLIAETLATRSELESIRSLAAEQLNDAVTKLCDERASREAVVELQRSHEASQSQLGAMQGVLATKVDRAEIIALRSVAAELQTFSIFKTAATGDLRELSQRTDENRAALNRSLESVAKLSAGVQSLATTVATKADRAFVDKLEEETSRLASEILLRATLIETEAIKEAHKDAVSRVSSIENSLTSVKHSITDASMTTENNINKSASGLRAEYAEALANLKNELESLRKEADARAYITSLEATDETVSSLSQEVELHSRKLDVVLKFVDWYSTKGESFEANASSIERHMNQLAMKNAARGVPSEDYAPLSSTFRSTNPKMTMTRSSE
jgi:hypothetical protein